MRHSKKSFLRGGVYHLALVLVAAASFNWGFATLTNIDIVGRVFTGITISPMIIAAILCASAVVVLWNNWVD